MIAVFGGLFLFFVVMPVGLVIACYLGAGLLALVRLPFLLAGWILDGAVSLLLRPFKRAAAPAPKGRPRDSRGRFIRA